MAPWANNMSSKLVRRDTDADNRSRCRGSRCIRRPPHPQCCFSRCRPRRPPAKYQPSCCACRARSPSSKPKRVAKPATAGRREGEAAGRQAAQAEVQAVLQKLAARHSGNRRVAPAPAPQAEADLVRLAVAIARRILHRELNTDPEAIGGLVRVALGKAAHAGSDPRAASTPIIRPRLQEVSAASRASPTSKSPPTPRRIAAPWSSKPPAAISMLSVETQLREIERGLTDRFEGQDAMTACHHPRAVFR